MDSESAASVMAVCALGGALFNGMMGAFQGFGIGAGIVLVCLLVDRYGKH